MSSDQTSNSDGAQKKTENGDTTAEQIMISEQKRIEKARLRLELQHRRKVKQLHMRLENRKRKQKGEKTHIIISAPAAAAAESTAASKKKAAEQFAAEQLAADKLAAEQLAADQLVADKLIADFNNSKNSADVGLSKREESRLNMQDRLRDRQIQALKERQAARKKMTAINETGSSSPYGSHSKTGTPRRSAFGAAAAREMHASRGSGTHYDDLSDTGKSYGHKTFTMDDFDELNADDYDIFLDAAQSQNDLTKFDKMYGLSSTAAAVEPVAPIDKKKKTPKRQIHRTSSFTDELDNLLQDIL